MKFDGNRAWKQAAGWVSANRDVLVALAGVFFLLPGLAASLFAPAQPVATAGMTAEQLMTVSRGYYLQSLPYTLPAYLLQALGSLAMLTLFTDRRRPTVAESIRNGLKGIVPYVLSQILLAAAFGIVGGMILFAITVTGSRPLIYAGMGIILAAGLYLSVRTLLLCGPVIAVEQVRNPITALVRSWRLTQDNSARLVLFLVLVIVLVLVITTVLSALVGIVLALVLSPANARIVLAVFSSALGAVATTYVIAVLGAVHRQLAGPTLSEERATFE